MTEDKDKNDVDKNDVDNETFEAGKMLLTKKYPEHASEIKLATTVSELNDVLEQIKDESQGEPKKRNLGVVEHVHRMAKEEKDDSDDEGSVDLSKTGGKIPLAPTTPKTRTWESTEAMLDSLFKTEMRGKIEKRKKKPNPEIIANGAEATRQIERLWDTAMIDKGGQHYIKRAREDLMRGRYTFSEPEWLRDLMNPEGRKHAKRKPFLQEE